VPETFQVRHLIALIERFSLFLVRISHFAILILRGGQATHFTAITNRKAEINAVNLTI
jgi:hypothetical protein